MNAKTWRFLFGLLGVLLLYVLVVERPWQDDIRGPEPKQRARLFDALDPSAVTAIEIRSGGKSTRLEKAAGAWSVATEGGFPADEKAVADLLARVDTLRAGAVVSTNPARQGTFGVDTAGVEVNFLAGARSMAHFRVGGSTPDFAGSFVRPEGGERVYGASGLSKFQFDRSGQGWRDRKIFKLTGESVRLLTLTHADSTVTLTRQGTDSLLMASWNLDSNQPGERQGNARREQVLSLVRQLENLAADAFPAAGDPGPSTWTPPAGKITIDLAGGDRKVLEFGPLNESGQHYVRVPGVQYGGREAVYLMGPWRLKNLARTYAELLEPTPQAQTMPMGAPGAGSSPAPPTVKK